MNASSHSRNRTRAGLTFLELLLAVAVSGLLLSASSHLLFSLAHFWQESEVEPRFVRHADGLASFLESCFDESAVGKGKRTRRVSWRPPPDERYPTFHFRFETAHPVFVTGMQPAPPVDAWVRFEEEQGLSLLWHVPVGLTENKIELQRTPLSAWVQDVEVGYYDKIRNLWEYESLTDTSRGRRRPAPQALRVVFEKDGRTLMRDIRMTRYDRHVLVY